MKRISYFLFSAFCVLYSNFCFAQQSVYQQAWAEYNLNNRSKAIALFEQATQDKSTVADAYMSLALLHLGNADRANALACVKKFYAVSENPSPYLYAVISDLPTRPLYSLTPEMVSLHEQIAVDQKTHGTMRTVILQNLGDYYNGINQTAKAQKYYAQTGAILDWQALGNFDNQSGSGFDKDWGAVSHPQADYAFKNVVDADVKWYSAGKNRADGWFDFNWLFALNEEIYYAQTFVNSPVNQKIIIRIGTSGSLKFWLNDAPVASVDEERNCDMDVYCYEADLNAGNNRLLIQIGQSEINNANFLLRLTDENGKPLPNLTVKAEYADYKKDRSGKKYEMLPFFAEKYFIETIEKKPDNLLNYILLGMIYLHNDKSHDGTRILKQAEMLAPQSSLVKEKLAEAYLRSKNQTDQSRMSEFIKQNDPNSLLALQYKFSELAEVERYDEAKTVYQTMVELYGSNEITDELELNLAFSMRNQDEILKLIPKLYQKYPYKYAYMKNLRDVYEQVYSNRKQSQKILEYYVKRYFNSSAWLDLANIYLKNGQNAKGIKQLDAYRERQPYNTGFLRSYASYIRTTRNFGKALQLSGELQQMTPYLSASYNLTGYIRKDMGATADAKLAFEKAVYYEPNDYDSRTQLRLLNSQKELFETFPKINLDSLIAAAPKAADMPEEEAVLLLEDNQTIVYPEGAQEHRVEMAVKILTKSAIENWKEYGVGRTGYQRIFMDKYETIKASGEKVKAETNGGERVVFTNLEVGDVLHLVYRLQDYRRGVLARHIYDFEYLQYMIPQMYVRTAILLPEEMKINYTVKNADILPVIFTVENSMKLYQWISTDKKAIKSEPYVPPFADVAPVLAYSSIPDWKFVSNWYRDITANKFNTANDYVFNETYSEILKSAPNAQPLEKAKLFYEYILNNITYSAVSFLQSGQIPQKPSRTIATRLGDCKDMATLFTALCRTAGIEANLVLVQSKENATNILALPTNAFNHCIAQMTIDNTEYFVELTDNKLPFRAVPAADINANILLIPFGNSTNADFGNTLLKLQMPARSENKSVRNKEISIQGNDMVAECRNLHFGDLASNMRHIYGSLGVEERDKKLTEAVAADYAVPVKLTNVKFTNLDNLADTVLYTQTLTATGAIQDVAGMMIFKLPWTDAVRTHSPFSLDERKLSFELWQYLYADSEYEQITLTLPAGKALMEKPANIRYECSAAIYEITFDTSVKGKLTATRRCAPKTDSVPPADYAELKKFLENVSTADNKQYAIK